MLELNQLYNMDCLDGMKLLSDRSIDMILCDLPYGTTACKWDSIIPLDLLWQEYKRIMKHTAVIALFGSQPFSSILVNSNPEMFRYEFIWEKEQGVNFLCANKMPLKIHENIMIFYLDKAEITGRSEEFRELRDYFNEEKESSGLSRKQFKELLGNDMAGHYFTDGVQFTLPTEPNYLKLQSTGFFKAPYSELKRKYDAIALNCTITYNEQKSKGTPYISGKGKSGDVTGNVVKVQTVNSGERKPTSILKYNRETGLHPTQKPVALCEYLIKTYTNENDIVFDNCAGSATTGIACMNTGRRYVLMEKDPNIYEMALNRIQNHEVCEQQAFSYA